MKKETSVEVNSGPWVTVIVFAIILILLPVASVCGNQIPRLSATRSIISSEVITPGDKIRVEIGWKVDNAVAKKLVLTETIPEGWTLASSKGTDSIFDEQRLTWSWQSVSAGESKTVTYEVKVPFNASAGSYPITGELRAFGSDTKDAIAKISVGGTQTLSVVNIGLNLWFFAATIAVILIVFLVVLMLGWVDGHNLDKGEMRRAIAATFVTGFTLITILCIYYGIYRSEVIIAYIEMVGIVIGFYFGAKTAAERRAEVASFINIENVSFHDPNKIFVTVRNGGDKEIKVDKVYINDKPFEKIAVVPSKTAKIIEIEKIWDATIEYSIKVATSEGLTTEIQLKSPEKKG